MIRLALVPLGGPLPGGAENARARWAERRGLGVVLTDPEGRVGVGEASPLPGYSEDTLEAAQAWLQARAGVLQAASHAQWAGVSRAPRAGPRGSAVAPEPASPGPGGHLDDPPRAGPIAAPGPGGSEGRAGGGAALALVSGLLEAVGSDGPPSARFGLEAALLGLAAARAGVDLAALLAGPEGPSAPPVQRLIDSLAPEVAATAVAGAAHVKVKVGRPGRFSEEQAVLRAVRAALPRGAGLRVDANQAFGADVLASRLVALADLGVDAVEEPGPPEAVDALAQIPLPLVLDESLRGPGGLDRALRLTQAGRVVAWALKPTVLGGVAATQAWARAARAAGAAVSIGHVFEGPAAHRAAAALARAVGSGPHGLAHHAGLLALRPASGDWAWPEPARIEGGLLVG